MKLIDLLVQELPNRGGWPDGALCATQSVIDGEIYFYNLPYDGQGCMPQMKGKILLPISDDSITGCEGLHPVITREQYEAALAAAQQPVWDGEGLPPVGCECERSWAGDKWLQCNVLFVSNEHAVVKLATREAAYHLSDVKFRPVRSEAERKRDETITKMRTCLAGTGAGITEHASSCLYDAIARGDIPGIKLSD